MAARSCRPVNTLMQMGSGNAKHVSDCLHREASFRGDTSCQLGFFAWALLRASLRISTSIVLRPSFEDMFIGHAPACGRIQALSYVAKRWGLVPVGRSTSGSYAFQVSD